MSDDIRRDDEDGVVTITFTRDAKRNAVTTEMFDAVRAAASDLAERADLKVLLITAEGRYFTAGVDFTRMNLADGRGTDGVTRGSTLRHQYRSVAAIDLYDALEAVEKPVVVAYQGPCLGLGIELGVSCDFRLAAARATFALPEVATMAVLPGSGGISRLTRLVGPHWAKWLAMAGQTVDAPTAMAMGLVHAVYPDDGFAERARDFARHLASLPGEALGVAKVAIDLAADTDRRSARAIDLLAQTPLVLGDESRDAVAKLTGGDR